MFSTSNTVYNGLLATQCLFSNAAAGGHPLNIYRQQTWPSQSAQGVPGGWTNSRLGVSSRPVVVVRGRVWGMEIVKGSG